MTSEVAGAAWEYPPGYCGRFFHEMCMDRPKVIISMLVQPRGRLVTFGCRAFSCVAPKLWNQLPTNLQKLTSTPVFAGHLKTYLFARYSREVWLITFVDSGTIKTYFVRLIFIIVGYYGNEPSAWTNLRSLLFVIFAWR